MQPMFSKAQFQTLFAYHWHTTQRLIKIAEQLPAQEYQDNPGYGHGSIHDLLFHILRTDYGWRLGLETGAQQAPVRPGDFPTLEALQQGLADEELAWQALLEKLTPEEIEGVFDLTDRRGATHSLPALAHTAAPGAARHAAPHRNRPSADPKRAFAGRY